MNDNDRATEFRKLIEKLMKSMEANLGKNDSDLIIDEPDFKVRANFGKFKLPFPFFPPGFDPGSIEIDAVANDNCEECPKYEECHAKDNKKEIDLELNDNPDRIVEINEEDGIVTVIAEFPGVTREDFIFKVADKALSITACKYKEEVELPCPVDGAENIQARYTNGILVLTLKKK